VLFQKKYVIQPTVGAGARIQQEFESAKKTGHYFRWREEQTISFTCTITIPSWKAAGIGDNSQDDSVPGSSRAPRARALTDFTDNSQVDQTIRR
jgi:hypothetical protein